MFEIKLSPTYQNKNFHFKTNNNYVSFSSLANDTFIKSENNEDDFPILSIKKFKKAFYDSHSKNHKIKNVSKISVLNIDTGKKEEMLLAKIKKPNSENSLQIYNNDIELIGSINKLDYKEGYKYIRLHFLESPFNKTYKGVGSKLIQAAVEESLISGNDGQLRVLAQNDTDYDNRSPFRFYAKMGFKFEEPELNMDTLKKDTKIIKNAVKNIPNIVKLLTNFYLQNVSICFWIKNQ